ncbi:radical SAM protein [Mesorhizobium sp. WSM4310]|uniref:radical SAM protein n=1 Tax=Mesorhizobium sp. WSM4310 TaxID=2589883 RepID=UPI001FF056AE|nr:radical SAM protein [Mesorhizobium sp. WSM4310]
MSFALTNACELACPYCYASKLPARLTFESILMWARELDSAGCFGIGFGGGEPTLFPGFVDLCRTLHEDTGLAVTMTTHGHRFSKGLVDALSGNVDFIRLSMDGIGPTYERLRGRPFSQFQEKLAFVRDTSRFGINFVVNNETWPDLQEAVSFAFKNGAEEFLLLPETTVDGDLNVSVELLAQLSSWAQNNYGQCRLAASAHGAASIDAPILISSNPRYESYDFMHVDAFGMLRTTAFAKNGLRLQCDASIIENISRLRAQVGSMGEIVQ